MKKLRHLLTKSKVGRRYLCVLPVEAFPVTGEVYTHSWLIQEYRQTLTDRALIRRAKRKIRKNLIPYFLESLEDVTHDFSFVSEPDGEYQDRYGYYVDQYCNGGYTGDEYSGSICFPLKNGKYFKFTYHC